MEAWDKRVAVSKGTRGAVLVVVLIAVTVCAPWPVSAAPPPEDGATRPASRPCRPAAKGERFRVDFDGVELGILARLVSCAAELDLMFAPRDLSSRTITVIAPRPVSVKDLVALFSHALHRNGLVLERRGRYGVIRPAAGGSDHPSPKRRSSKGR